MTASPSSSKYSFCMVSNFFRISSAFASVGNAMTTRSLMGYSSRVFQIDRFWLDVRARVSNELPFAGKLSSCGDATRLDHHRQQNQAADRQSVCLHHDTLHCLVI